MKLLELKVESFQCVERAEVKLGRALNILYGPNDLGKSTLAQAIRAALLVASGSTEGDRFAPWYKDAGPRVELEFADDKERVWRVHKSFGRGASAELKYAKDGRSFVTDCRARQVEEKLREMLSWGVPAPAGGGRTRGTPTSFLINVLLAGQTDVESVFEVGLDKDGDESGKTRLRKALSALAEHPLYKSVLDRARDECDKHFTATGKVKRGADSILKQVAEAIHAHQQELGRLRAQLEESRHTEEQVSLLRDAEKAAMVARTEAEETLRTVSQGLENARMRHQAEEVVRSARAALKGVEEHEARIQALEREQVRLSADASMKGATLQVSREACEEAQRALRSAEEAQRIAGSEAAAQERQLRAAALKTEAAQLETHSSKCEAACALARRAQEARNDELLVAQTVGQLNAQVDVLEEARNRAALTQEKIANEAEIARAILEFGRWRAAVRAVEEADATRRRVAELEIQIAQKQGSAAQLQQECATRAAALSQRRACLPGPDTLAVLRELEHEIQMAEAKLGGGLRIAVRPRQEISVRTVLDGAAAVENPGLAHELVLDAQRSVQLSLADLVDVEITAGTADARETLARLKERWKADATPVLTRAGVQSASELMALENALSADERAAQDVQRTMEAAQREAVALAEQAKLLEQQLAREVSDLDQLSELERAVGDWKHELLQPHLEQLGKGWEAAANAAYAKKQQLLVAAQNQVAKAGSDLAVHKSKLESHQAQLESRRRATAVALHPLDGEDAHNALGRLEAELSRASRRLKQIEGELRSLDAAAGAERTEAELLVVAAKQRCVQADEVHGTAEKALEGVRGEVNRVAGQLTAMNLQLTGLDRPNVVLRVQTADSALASLPSGPLATEQDLAKAQDDLKRAEAALDEQSEAVHKAEGALSKVGGAQLRERERQKHEELAAAQVRERDLTLDANAWKLLHETLKEVGENESDHLGRALSGPVEEKFMELTRGRYEGLRFATTLCAEGLGAPGATSDADVLSALSVGTRDQLATLIRLTIAAQVKCAVILDDHLVHTDPSRILWFRDLLRRTAVDTQVVVFTCRPNDYLQPEELPVDEAFRDVVGGTTRAINLEKLVTRFDAPAQAARTSAA
jgi:hypothetical protein